MLTRVEETQAVEPSKVMNFQTVKYLLFQAILMWLSVCFVFFVNNSDAFAGSSEVEVKTGVIDQTMAPPGYGLTNGSVIVAPIPFSNPTIGSGLALGAGYIFKSDESSSPSLIGIGAMRSDNGSEAYGVSFRFARDNNKWKITSFIGSADLNYDLFTPVGELPISQEGVLARFGLSYGVTPQLSFGGSLKYLSSKIALDQAGGTAIPAPFSLDLDTEVFTVGFLADWDRRDDTVYATSGSNLHFEANAGLSQLIGDRQYQKGVLLYDVFHKVGQSSVLAGRFATCASSSTTPFFDKCSLGGTDSFRGFSATEFLNTRLASLQIEFRQRLGQRFGMTVFGGAGGVGSSFGQLFDNGAQTALGIGGRYRVSQKFPVDFSVDYVVNDQNEELVYLYVGQRF